MSYKASDIKVLEGLEAVRTRPAMYIGNTGFEGLHHLIFEVVDNSIDEALAGYCTSILVKLNEDGSAEISDDGRGIPVDIHESEGIPGVQLVMTKLHAGGKFDNKLYKVSGGLHGVGVSVVNALSEYLEVYVRRDGYEYFQRYERGKPVTDLIKQGPANNTGTTVRFFPDKEIFETITFDPNYIIRRLRELAFLTTGVKINFYDEVSGISREFYYEGGIVAFVRYLNKGKEVLHPEPIYIFSKKNDTLVEIALQYNTGYNENILTYANNINTSEGGSHLVGFKAGLTRSINQAIVNSHLAKAIKEKLSGEDVREGLTAVISVKLLNPQFEGQTKTRLGNSEIKGIVENVVNEGLSRYFEENPQVFKSIISKAVEAARAREAARKARELARKKASMADFSIPSKLADCQEKDPSAREIFIVEGDSAGGSAKQARDRRFQAVLPIKGKILNVEKARFDKILGSEEIKTMISALGTGIGEKNFDISSLRYHKIIIMTDADVDGAHIRTLLLTFFFRQMREIIEKGYLYVAQPPLYRVLDGKQELYLKDEQAFDEFLFQRACTKETLIFRHGEEFKGESLKRLLLELKRYSKAVERLTRHGYERDLIKRLLELGLTDRLLLKDRDFVLSLVGYLKESGYDVSQVESDPDSGYYRFRISRSTNGRVPIIIDWDFISSHDIHTLLTIWKARYSLLNREYRLGERSEWSVLLNFESLLEEITTRAKAGLTIQRYKGLGEMNPEQLWETTMDPQRRNLVKVKIQDHVETEWVFSTLMGDEVAPRKDFIMRHALEVTDLDV